LGDCPEAATGRQRQAVQEKGWEGGSGAMGREGEGYEEATSLAQAAGLGFIEPNQKIPRHRGAILVGPYS